MPSEHYQRIRQAFNQPWPGNERCACGKPWPCPDAADSHSGVPVEGLQAAALALCNIAARFSAGDSDVQRDDLQVAIDDVRRAAAPREASEPPENDLTSADYWLAFLVAHVEAVHGCDHTGQLREATGVGPAWSLAPGEASEPLHPEKVIERLRSRAPREAKTPGERE